jgi:hypothetical protein
MDSVCSTHSSTEPLIAASFLSAKSVTITTGSGLEMRSFTICLHSTTPPPQFASEMSKADAARSALESAGYLVDGALMRKLDMESGEGFWDIAVGVRRIVHYGPGEYVEPHFHDIAEQFTIRQGSCFVWTSEDHGLSWNYLQFKTEEFLVPAGAWHCLVAGPEGLSMHVDREPRHRKNHWLDRENSQVWRKDLLHTSTIKQLKEATELALSV